MCGVFGAIETGLTESALTAAGNALAHRGPDAAGIFQDPELSVGLVHRRLSIIDPEKGDQPLFDRDGNTVLVCNGEIYDYERLRAELRREGYAFQTGSDSEIILQMYLKHGLEFLTRLRGEYAFLLLDRKRGRLVAARDRFGIKPLCFAGTDSGGWCFASEAKAMSAAGLKRLIVDLKGYQHDENCSLFRGVYNVPPATALVFDLSDRTFEARTYWHPDFPADSELDRDKTLSEWAAEIDASLTEAIRLRLRADAPVGVYLSGGIDSAIIAAKAARLADSAPPAFTVSFPDAPRRYDEGEEARRIAAHLGLEHHILQVSTADLWANLERCLYYNEAPITNFAPVAKYMLSAFAAERVKVVLTGEGADEVFLGYPVYKRMLRASQKNGADVPPASVRHRAGQRLRHWLRRQLPSMGLPMTKRLKTGARPQSPEGIREQSRDATQLEGRSKVVRFQYQRLKRHLSRVILTAYGDRMEMAHSLEGRVPFLDHCLFDRAKRIPPACLIDGDREKMVLRELATGLLPADAVSRTKWIFSTPRPAFDPGCHQSLDSLVERYLSRAAIRRTGLFKWSGICLIWGMRRFQRFQARADRLLFTILCIQILHDWFTGPAASESTGTEARAGPQVQTGKFYAYNSPPRRFRCRK